MTLRLIGMLDSPYVRRVAIGLQLLGLPFEHHSLSVFRGFDEFRGLNPVVKAPTLLCDDGTVLMDSSLILDYAQARARRSLLPTELTALHTQLRIIGLALAACEKSVQIIYEHGLRPPEKQHAPWVTRVTTQLLAAYGDLETEIARHPLAAGTAQMTQAGIITAVAWHFTQQMLPEVVPADRFAHLVQYSARAEATPPFKAAPHGSATYAAAPSGG